MAKTCNKRNIALDGVARFLAAVFLMVFAAASAADEAAVRRLINSKLRPGDKLESVQKTSYGDLYEVTLRSAEGPFIYYVDSGATAIISGNVIDARTGQNLTEARQRKLTAVKWESLPLESAVTTVRGNGKRKIAVFSDPNCPFCKRFEETLEKIDDITVHIFLYPVIKPESVSLTKSVWCSKDRSKAWNDLMLRGVRPQAPTDCNTPVDRLVEFGRRLGATSTPTWFLANGERYQGALPLEQVRALLDEASLRR